jgi:AcrR family transcriptional regulator
MMTRNEILEAAAQIFSQKGYHASSMNEIASAVNLQKASLYHHVRSKQEILLSLLNEALDILFDQIHSVIEQQIPIEEKLRLAIQTYLKTLTDQLDLAAVLLLEYRSLDKELLTRHLPRRDRFEDLWSDILLEGVNDGVFNIQDINMATRALLGMMNWVVTWYRENGALGIHEISDRYADQILNGYLVR